jgi:hypothetical protein
MNERSVLRYGRRRVNTHTLTSDAQSRPSDHTRRAKYPANHRIVVELFRAQGTFDDSTWVDTVEICIDVKSNAVGPTHEWSIYDDPYHVGLTSAVA